VVDAVVLSGLNKRSLTSTDFTAEPLSGAVSLSSEGYASFYGLNRRNSQVQASVLGRQCTYQEAFEIQARLLAEVPDG